MGSRPSDFIRNLGTSVSQLVDPQEREDMVRTAARAAAAGVAAEVDEIRPGWQDHAPTWIAEAVEQATRAAVRGGVRELEASLPELHHTFTQARTALQQYVLEHSHPVESGPSGPRMQQMAEGLVRGATTELRKNLSEVAADLRRLAARDEWDDVEAGLELAVEVFGRKLVAGMVSELRRSAADVDAGNLIRGVSEAAAAGGVLGFVSGLRGSGLRWRWPVALLGMTWALALVLVVRRR